MSSKDSNNNNVHCALNVEDCLSCINEESQGIGELFSQYDALADILKSGQCPFASEFLDLCHLQPGNFSFHNTCIDVSDF